MRVLLSGNIPDPSILEDGGAYYLVYSTLRYFPGMLLYRSDDLRHWERVCTIVQGGLKDIWAPDLVKHKGRYYIYFAADGKNWVVWSDRIDGGYSDPIDLQADGWIDPGHAVDRETGRRYLFFNNGYAAPLSDDGLSLTAPPERVADAWPIPADWDVEGVYMESPKILDKNGYYYLTVAQGGTAGPPTSHMAISLRSRQLLSGWEFSPYNPVIHCRGADEKWWSTGHATIFDDKNGDTYALYHGYPRDDRKQGRQALLSKVEWTADGWYRIIGQTTEDEDTAPEAFQEDFSASPLSLRWSFFDGQDPALRGYLSRPGEWLLPARGSCLGEANVMAVQATGRDYEVTAWFGPSSCGFGAALFYNERCHVGLGVRDGRLWQIDKGAYIPAGEWTAEETACRIVLKDNVVSMFVSRDGGTFHKCPASFAVGGYEHNNFGGFLALQPGMFAEGEGEARLRGFRFRPL